VLLRGFGPHPGTIATVTLVARLRARGVEVTEIPEGFVFAQGINVRYYDLDPTVEWELVQDIAYAFDLDPLQLWFERTERDLN
jgi:hypothetical protein